VPGRLEPRRVVEGSGMKNQKLRESQRRAPHVGGAVRAAVRALPSPVRELDLEQLRLPLKA